MVRRLPDGRAGGDLAGGFRRPDGRGGADRPVAAGAALVRGTCRGPDRGCPSPDWTSDGLDLDADGGWAGGVAVRHPDPRPSRGARSSDQEPADRLDAE